MSKKKVHTVPHGSGWANRSEGASRVFSPKPTKSEAEKAGRGVARERGVEHLSHRQDGTIGERRSYGGDPYPPKG